ncbi:MAG TPA: RDD family protein [Acidimicrobiia bacterium]|nr:RDD family protein [Acidimicrobiia bacterium]
MKRIDQPAGSHAPQTEGMALAEWWRRFGGAVVDLAVIWLPLWPLTRSMDRPARLVVSLVVGVLYFALLNGGARGQTVGKMVWGTRVRDGATGGALGPAKAAMRYLAPALLSIVTFGLIWFPDGLWLLWDRRRQTLHDKIVGSVVVIAD